MERPLSPEGCCQAEGLVVRLEDYPVERILCSPTVRCHQTVQPLADDRLLGIEGVAALGVDAAPAEVLALFWDRRLRNAVLSLMPPQHHLKPDAESLGIKLRSFKERRVGKMRFCKKDATGSTPTLWWVEEG